MISDSQVRDLRADLGDHRRAFVPTDEREEGRRAETCGPSRGSCHRAVAQMLVGMTHAGVCHLHLDLEE